MKKYLFLILDRYESSLSTSFQIKSKLSPIQVFRNCMLEIAEWDEEDYDDYVADEVCYNKSNTTWDAEERSYLLIELVN